MNIDNFVNSCLKVTAKENLFIENDLSCAQSKSIQELINEEKTKEQEQEQETNKEENS